MKRDDIEKITVKASSHQFDGHDVIFKYYHKRGREDQQPSPRRGGHRRASPHR